MGTIHVVTWAAHDPRTGERLTPARFTPTMADKDAAKLEKKGQETVVHRVGELRS